MSTGNKELDAILEWQAKKQQSQLQGSDARRLRYIARLMQSGITEMQRARSLLGDLVEEIEGRVAQEERTPEGRSGC